MPEIPSPRTAPESRQGWLPDTQPVDARAFEVPELDELNLEIGVLDDACRMIRQTSARSSEQGDKFVSLLTEASHPLAAAKIPTVVIDRPGGPESEPGQTWEQAYKTELTDALRNLGVWLNNSPVGTAPGSSTELEVNRQLDESHPLHYSELVAGAVLRLVGARAVAEHEETDPQSLHVSAVASYETKVPGLTMTARITQGADHAGRSVKLYARFEHPATPPDHPNRPPDPNASHVAGQHAA